MTEANLTGREQVKSAAEHILEYLEHLRRAGYPVEQYEERIKNAQDMLKMLNGEKDASR